MRHRTYMLKIVSLSFAVAVIADVLLLPTADGFDDYSGEEMMGSPSDVHALSFICRYANDAQKCESTVRSISPGLTDTTPDNVQALHIEAARRNTRAGLQAAAQLLNGTRADDAATRTALQTCVAGYEAAARGVEDVAKGRANWVGGAYGIVASMVSVPDQCRKCEDAAMAGYNGENEAIMKNLLRLYRLYWGITDEMAFHTKNDDPLDMDSVRENCGRAENVTECVSSVEQGAELANYKGDTNSVVVLQLLGAAMQKNIEEAAGIVKEMVKANGGSAALGACDGLYSEAGTVIDRVFDGQLSVVVDGASWARMDGVALKKRLAKVKRLLNKCRAAMDQDQGLHVDGALLDLQRRLLTQVINFHEVFSGMWP